MRLDQLKVVIRQIKPNAIGRSFRKDTGDFYAFACLAWIDISVRGKMISHQYRPCDPVGGGYGVYLPKKQPSPNYIALVVLNDYDGRLLLIDKHGHVSDYAGGEYWVTRDGRYLFSVYYTDGDGLEIIDLKSDRSIFFQVFETDASPDKWFEHNGSYSFTKENEPDSLYTFSFKMKRFVARKMDAELVARSRPIEYDFVPPERVDCGCQER